MFKTRKAYNSYDHKIKGAIAASGHPYMFPGVSIPKSTAKTWINNGISGVITHPIFSYSNTDLYKKVLELEKENKILAARLSLLQVLLNFFNISLNWKRLPEGFRKKELLEEIRNASQVMKISVALKTIGLSSSRYYSWLKLEKGCELEDYSSCPRSNPDRLTSQEISIMKEMVLNPDYSHLTVRALSFFAKRIKKVFASASTWGNYIKEYGWKRPARVMDINKKFFNSII